MTTRLTAEQQKTWTMATETPVSKKIHIPVPYHEFFAAKNYVVIKGFYCERDVKRMARRMDTLMAKGMLTQDPQCPKSYSIYGDPIHAEIHEYSYRHLGELLKIDLLPTYTYSRIYSPREVLKLHSDRPSCEISVTTTLEYDTPDNKPWIIYVESESSDAVPCDILDEDGNKQRITGIPITLECGDALVYRGCEVRHWRTPFMGFKQTQLFLHHVDANGPYKDYVYDGRPSLGSSVFTKDERKLAALDALYDKGHRNENKTHEVIR